MKRTNSFVYEKLVSKIQKVQNQILETNKILDDRWENQKEKSQEFKSRSFTFIDPYGNRTTNKFMDHESMTTVFRKYKKNYVPKYLHKYIKIGKVNDHKILPLTEYELIKTVSEYENECLFETYGELVVQTNCYTYFGQTKFVLTVRLTETMENIQKQINENLQCENLEFKSLTLENDNKSFKKNWNEGTSLKLNETILSAQLYQENFVILAKDKKMDPSSNIVSNTGISNTTQSSLPNGQQLVFGTTQLADGRSLNDYNIRPGSILYLTLRARGGMYHFTSGRQDFIHLPYESAKAIKKILTFQLKYFNQTNDLTSTELQEFVLEAQTALSNLFHQLKEVYIPEHIPNVNNILSSVIHENEHDDNSDSDDE